VNKYVPEESKERPRGVEHNLRRCETTVG